MSPRQRPAPLPDDDLYGRLEVPPNASAEAIEVAWRALLKRHHPDVAGDEGLEHAKRINVAHDWLSDSDLRARYDAERHPRSRQAGPSSRGSRGSAWRTSTRRPTTIDRTERRRRFLERVAALTADELDRLGCAESPPLAFVAAIRRFLLPDRLAAVEAIEAEVRLRLDPAAWREAHSRDAVLGAAHDLVLGDFLDEHLDEPFRERAHERLTRAWDAAVGQPRYGPNSVAVAAFVDRARRLDGAHLQGLEDRRSGVAVSAALPWPPDLDPAENEGLRVSSVLAARDATAAVGERWPSPSRRVRALLARTAHALVLRHAFGADQFASLTAAWREGTGDPLAASTNGVPPRGGGVNRPDRPPRTR